MTGLTFGKIGIPTGSAHQVSVKLHGLIPFDELPAVGADSITTADAPNTHRLAILGIQKIFSRKISAATFASAVV